MSVLSLIVAAAERLCAAPESEVVFSSRVRLARNFRDIPFPHRASTGERSRVVQRVLRVAREARGRRLLVLPVGSLPPLELEALAENHLISREMVAGGSERAVIFSPEGDLCAMVNEEDHVRVQALVGGLDLEGPLRRVNEFERMLGRVGELAYKEGLGFLTACPSNVGTGLRASVLLRLPALYFTKRLQSALDRQLNSSITVRGIYGEGSKPAAFLLQLSNQRTAEQDPEAIVANVSRVARALAQAEHAAREALVQRFRPEVEDLVLRAAGTLRSARLISSEEAMEKLAQVRLGLDLGILRGVAPREVDRLMLLVRPATLQLVLRQRLATRERDFRRATFIRQRLSQLRAAC